MFKSMDKYMEEALREAGKAAAMGEVPVGAVIVRDGQIIARGHNRTETDRDPTAHAEMIAIRAAAQALGGWRLPGCTLYVTLEPCSMCAGAIVWARIERLVIGTMDPKAGACGSVCNLVQEPRFNHRVEVEVLAGPVQEACAQQLKDFFRARRRAQKPGVPDTAGHPVNRENTAGGSDLERACTHGEISEEQQE